MKKIPVTEPEMEEKEARLRDDATGAPAPATAQPEDDSDGLQADLDRFRDLALRSQKNEGAEAALRSGIELIRKQMDDVLSRLGVQVIPAQGSTFDPRVHEAIEMVESADHADHEVIDELQRGYKLKERLLRPAMVRVATNPTGK